MSPPPPGPSPCPGGTARWKEVCSEGRVLPASPVPTAEWAQRILAAITDGGPSSQAAGHSGTRGALRVWQRTACPGASQKQPYSLSWGSFPLPPLSRTLLPMPVCGDPRSDVGLGSTSWKGCSPPGCLALAWQGCSLRPWALCRGELEARRPVSAARTSSPPCALLTPL